MFIMKNFLNKNKFLVISLLIFICFGCFIGASFTLPQTYAQEKTAIYLPSSDLEYKTLTAPSDVYHDDEVTAIIHNGALLLYVDGQYKTPLTNFESLKQVKKFNDGTLLISNNGGIYSINLSSPNTNTALVASNGNNIGGNYFDLNSEYMVTAFGNDGLIYTRASNQMVYVGKFTLDGDKPVAINENNQIFFVDNGIYTVNAKTPTENAVKISNVSPVKMIARGSEVFYLLDNDSAVYKLNLSDDNSVTKLTANTPEYDLGNLEKPSGLAFKGENLLITDTKLNAIQEFAIVNDILDFTGFAIATDKTAYNRISKTASDIEKYNGTIAVLDDNKLTVISNSAENKYSKENFKNYINNVNIDQNVQYFALGNGKILYSTTSTQLKMLDLNSENEAVQIELDATSAIIDDLCYQSGKFYVLLHNSTQSIVYKIEENVENYFAEKIYTQSNSPSFGAIAVDVYGCFYLAGSSGILKYQLNDKNQYEKVQTISQSPVNKLATDLGGKLYILADGTLKCFDGTSLKTVTPTPHNNGDTIKSFALNFDEKEICLLYENKEYICATTAVDNYSISGVTVLNDVYVVTDKNADVNTLKKAVVTENANTYSVNRTLTGFKFNELINPETEYVYICDVKFDNSLCFAALGGQNGVVLVNKTQLKISNAEIEIAPQKAFTTTTVSAYYLPIISKNAEYTLTDGQSIRIDKHAEIQPLLKISALGKDFYFASILANGKTYQGYIPIDFTVEILSQDVFRDSYTIVKVENTFLYKDVSLTEKIFDLDKNTQVRLVSTENGVAKVLINVDGNFVEGYINTDKIINEPKTAIINIIIILSVSICVSATALFFILKKKKR